MSVTFNHQKFAPVPGRSMCELTVLDDSDPDIVYDEQGVCLVARQAQHRLQTEYFGDKDGEQRLATIVDDIKQEGRGKEYDCIIGVSGGVDSTYIAWMIKEFGLRALAVHLDNGWDTELAQANIERTINKLGIDLFTYVVDWEEIRDLQRSLFKASLIDIEMVTDHAINAVLFGQAAKRNVRYIIPGSNITTESLMPAYYAYDQRDLRNLLAVHRRFGTRRLKSYPMLSAKKMLYYIFVKRVKFIPFLNYIPYNKNEALALLKDKLGYVPYARKHGESRFTRFFQEYYLPTKFNIDKRKAHFSALILSGQMTRDEALAELNKPLYRPDELEEELDYVTDKLGFTREEFADIMRMPGKRHTDYPNLAWLFDPSSPALQFVKRFAKGESGSPSGRPAPAT
jgi:N-acetyl sugar amidotransferase